MHPCAAGKVSSPTGSHPPNISFPPEARDHARGGHRLLPRHARGARKHVLREQVDPGRPAPRDPHRPGAAGGLVAEVMIRLDSSHAVVARHGPARLREIGTFGMRNHEDPVATFEDTVAMRRHSAIPFPSHLPDIRCAVALGVAGFIVTNFAVLGGINRAVRFIGTCEAMGIGFGATPATPGSARPPTSTSRRRCLGSPAEPIIVPLVGGRCDRGWPVPAGGHIVLVPDRPGLDVAFDRAALDQLAPALRRARPDGPLPRPKRPASPDGCRSPDARSARRSSRHSVPVPFQAWKRRHHGRDCGFQGRVA